MSFEAMRGPGANRSAALPADSGQCSGASEVSRGSFFAGRVAEICGSGESEVVMEQISNFREGRRYRSLRLRSAQLITEGQDGFDCFHGKPAIINFFGIREVFVGDQQRSFFAFVISLRPQRPSVPQPLLSLQIMSMFRQRFGQVVKFRRQRDLAGVDGMRLVIHAIIPARNPNRLPPIG